MDDWKGIDEAAIADSTTGPYQTEDFLSGYRIEPPLACVANSDWCGKSCLAQHEAHVSSESDCQIGLFEKVFNLTVPYTTVAVPTAQAIALAKRVHQPARGTQAAYRTPTAGVGAAPQTFSSSQMVQCS